MSSRERCPGSGQRMVRSAERNGGAVRCAHCHVFIFPRLSDGALTAHFRKVTMPR